MIQSPAFPEYFPVQSQCQWQVTPSENLKISFMNWDMPVERDICRSVNLMIVSGITTVITGSIAITYLDCEWKVRQAMLR